MQTTIQYIENELMELYPASEISSFSRLIIESVYGLSYTEQVLRKHEELDEAKFSEISKIVSRLKNFEPIQYILGETGFYDLKLKVTPSVLIPRPETEELVAWILEENLAGHFRILDVGTGSGCIALALQNEIPQAEVSGIDVSEGALQTARENARRNNLDVNFFQQDILKWRSLDWPEFDLIVSNPPYVRESEKKMMEENVLKYEPEGALYVSDDDPLIFYRTIAEFAKEKLKEKGRLFFEINEYLASEMEDMLKQYGFKSVECRKDLSGRDRMMACTKKSI